jgi:cell division septal protein FtsQ
MFEDIIRIIRSVSREMKDNTMAKQNMTIRQVSTTPMVIFFFAIALSVIFLFTCSDYRFGIFNPFF